MDRGPTRLELRPLWGRKWGYPPSALFAGVHQRSPSSHSLRPKTPWPHHCRADG
jgi:hypothetical protein